MNMNRYGITDMSNPDAITSGNKIVDASSGVKKPSADSDNKLMIKMEYYIALSLLLFQQMF